MLTRNVQVAHNFSTILLYNFALLYGQPKLKPGKTSMPSALLAQLITLRKNQYGSLQQNVKDIQLYLPPSFLDSGVFLGNKNEKKKKEKKVSVP